MGALSSRFLIKNIDSLVGLGLPESDLMAVVPGQEEALNNPLMRFSGDVLVELLRLAENLSGDPAIGFRCGLNHGNVTYNDIAFTILHCKNFRESFEVSERFEPLAQTIGINKLVVEGDIARIFWITHENNPEKLRHVTDISFATLARLGLWMKAVHGLSVQKLQLRHSNKSYHENYIEMFDCPIEYGAEHDVLSFDKAFLSVPLPGYNPGMLRLLSSRLEHDLSLLEGDISDVETVKAYLNKKLGAEPCTMKDVAKMMAMPEWGLRRSLKVQGTSFREILENVRRDRYELFAEQGIHTQVQIAGLLGYSEQSAFSRAYKKWYGAAPVRSRRK